MFISLLILKICYIPKLHCFEIAHTKKCYVISKLPRRRRSVLERWPRGRLVVLMPDATDLSRKNR